MNRIKTGIKLQVTPKQSQQVQEICFANGIVWGGGDRSVMFTHKPFLHISMGITFGDDVERFKEHHNEEVDATFFIRTKGSCIEEIQEFKVGDIVGVYCPHPLCGYTNVKVVGVDVDNYILEAGKDLTGHIPHQLRNKNFIVEKSKVFVSEYEQQFLLNKNIKENKMKDNEVETYKDVKEYLIAKGLYERVLEIDWETYEEDTFSGLFTWSETEEKHNFWNELSKEMLDLGIEKNIESLVQDYKAKQGKEFIKHIETKPLEKPKQYLCFVQGKALPKHIHKTLEQAKQEAQRLCRKELAKVSVLEVVAEFQAEVLVKEVL